MIHFGMILTILQKSIIMKKNILTFKSGKQVVNVLIKIVVKKYKKEEFLESMHMCEAKIRKQQGCLSFDLYQDAYEENIFRLMSEWESPGAMEKHFTTHEFEFLLGAAKVLCESFEIETTEMLQIGDLDWAWRQIRPPGNTGENKIQ